jgi:L-alanine-DL-glutamate epimerase-like enolase superfamily enzyme
VAIYEEPCPFEDYESTRQVTAALKRIVVAGGEQDHSWYRFRDIVKGRVLDMVQPDLSYNGGFVRATRVARLAAQARLPISPHCPNASTMAYTLHFAAFTPNLGPFQEYHVNLARTRPWYAQDLKLKEGHLTIPEGAGFGFTLDPARLAKAVVV